MRGRATQGFHKPRSWLNPLSREGEVTFKDLTIKPIKAEGVTRTAWLTKLGVPAAFHAAIINAPNDRTTAAGGVVLGVAMLAVVIGIVVAAFMGLDAYV